MTKELVVSANRHETKVAILEDDLPVELYFQRANEYSLAGSIHKGRVTRVLPGMQSAFVDLGLERDTFLYVSDFFEENEDFDRIPSAAAAPRVVETAELSSEGAAAQGAGVQGGAPATAAPPEVRESRESREVRDRRERRGRRRRGRGRGLPESKYATEVRAESAPEPATETEAVHAAPQESDSRKDFAVLPGESLAKYRHAGAAALEPELTERPGSPGAHDTADLESGHGSVAAKVPAAKVSGIHPPATAPPEIAEAAEYPPDNAEPDAPEHPTPLSEEPELDLQSIVTADIDLITEPEGLSAEEVIKQSEPDIHPLDEDEDREIQAFILGEGQEGEEESEEEPGEESEETVETGTSGAAAEPAEAVAPEPAAPRLRADLRDQGSRYLHRVSRRTRRRMRGGEGRETNEGRESSRDTRPSDAVAAPGRAEQPSISRSDRPPQPSITDLLREGQEIIVQIAKEPLGQKGARITSHIALPGRYVVYMPTLEHMGVSRRIASDEERQRLKRILQGKRPGPVGGFITRTAAEGRSEDEIGGDMEFLYNLWQDIRNKADKKPAPALLHHDLDIVQRILRDQLGDSFKAIWIDNEETYESVLRFVERFQPALVGKVKMYTREAPIFDAFSVTSELEKALRPKVWLKSGGFIVINQTEALVAIDVNTGKYVGKTNRLEDTIVKTNTEAIKEIVRQVRLRDLGGIIVIDFIDIDERKNRQKVMQVLEEAMRADRAPYKILQFNDFGLVAITRKRVKQSLERTLCSPCPYCEGAGYVKSVQTVIGEILQEAQKLAAAIEHGDVTLRVHPEVAKVLKANDNKFLEELEEILGRPVLVK